MSISQKIVFQRKLQHNCISRASCSGPTLSGSHCHSSLSLSKYGVLTGTAVPSFGGRHVSRADMIAMVTDSALCASHHLGIPTHHPIFSQVLIAPIALLQWERLRFTCDPSSQGEPQKKNRFHAAKFTVAPHELRVCCLLQSGKSFNLNQCFLWTFEPSVLRLCKASSYYLVF